jgi:membrane protein YqaA with SNARE-associated domain
LILAVEKGRDGFFDDPQKEFVITAPDVETPKKKGMTKRLYEWMLHWAETPYAIPALFVFAFIESSFFPIPPDPLLILLCLGLPKKSFKYAATCAVASVCGGMLGYGIGYMAYDIVGTRIIEFYGLQEKIVWLAGRYSEVGVMALAIAGFTPVPYKLFTIATGMFDAVANGAAAQSVIGIQVEGLQAMGLSKFVVVSAITRSARFFLVGGMIYFFGDWAKVYIEKYFDKLAILFVILLVLGFIAIKFLH